MQCSISAIQVVHSFSGHLAKIKKKTCLGFQGWVLLCSLLQTLKPAIISLVIWLQRPPYWLHLHPLAIPPFTSPWISRTLAPPVNQPGPDGPNMAHGSRWPQYGTCGPCEPSPLPSACTLWVKDLTHSTNQPFALFLEPSHSDTQSLFIWLRLRKPLVPWQLLDLNSQLDPKAARGLNSLCPLQAWFSLSAAARCVFSWRPKWPHSTLPTAIGVTLRQLSRATTGHHHLYPPTFPKCEFLPYF